MLLGMETAWEIVVLLASVQILILLWGDWVLSIQTPLPQVRWLKSLSVRLEWNVSIGYIKHQRKISLYWSHLLCFAFLISVIDIEISSMSRFQNWKQNNVLVIKWNGIVNSRTYYSKWYGPQIWIKALTKLLCLEFLNIFWAKLVALVLKFVAGSISGRTFPLVWISSKLLQVFGGT